MAQPPAPTPPTHSTCGDFCAGRYARLPTLLPHLKRNKINTVSPGVFFYYATVAKGSGATGFIQTAAPSGFPLYGVQNGQAYLYTVSGGTCTRVETLLPSGTGQYSGGGTLPAGNYILGVKFETSTANGVLKSLLPATNTFTLIGGGSTASVQTVIK